MGWNSFYRRRDQRALGVVDGLEKAFFDFLVSLTNIVLHFLGERFQFLQVDLHGIGKITELEWKQIRVRQAHYGRAAGLSERAAVDKVRVAKMRIPVEIVIDGMVDAASVFASKSDVQRGYAVVLQECGVVRARTERRNAQISSLANFLALLRSLGIGDFVELLAFPNAHFRFGVEYLARNIVAEFFQRMRALHFEISAAVGIRVNIRDTVRAQFVIMLLGPFGRAKQAGLFSVPRAVNDGALGLPSRLHQLPKRPSFFHKGDLTGDGILCAVHPPIVMVAANYPLIGKRCALNFSDDVINRLDVPIRLHFEVDFRGAGPDVIGDAEAAAPSFRSHAASQGNKQWLRIRVGNRQDRDFRNRWSVFNFQTLGIFRCANARRERVTGIKGHVRDAPPLDSIRRTISAGGERLSLDESIFMRVGEYEAADSAVFGGNFRLDAAPGVEVARDDNLPLYRNAHALELLVVFRDSVVNIDERSGHVAIDRVSVIGGKLLGLLIGGGILHKRGLLELGNELRAAVDKLDETFFRRGKEDVKLLDVCVETKLLEFRGDPFGVVLVVGRANVVRVRGKSLHVSAEVVRTGNGTELLFPLAFDAGRLGGIAEKRLLVSDDV